MKRPPDESDRGARTRLRAAARRYPRAAAWATFGAVVGVLIGLRLLVEASQCAAELERNPVVQELQR